MHGITPCLWFNDNAEEAVAFYLSIFPNARVVETSYYGKAGPGPEGGVMAMSFLLNGREFMAINGGPQYHFTPAVSFVVQCDSQKDIDCYWDKLSSGGAAQPCGWLVDRFGVSWQIVPTELIEMMRSTDAKRVRNLTKAMLGMSKLDIVELQAAFDQD